MGSLVIRVLIVYALLMLFIRLSGKREVGQLDVSEFVSTIILSEIATLPIGDTDIPISNAIIPIIILVCVEIIVTFVKNKSNILKRIFESRPCILINKGKIQPKALEKMRISMEELMGEIRLKGVPDISQVYYAIIEHNGNISVIQKTDEQPLIPKDAKIHVPEGGISRGIIVDGEINHKSLQAAGKDEHWLNKQLTVRGISREQVFYMSVNDNNEIYVSKKEND